MSILWAIDVDGTLADNSQREYLLRLPTPDWDAYFDYDLTLEDKPIKEALQHFESGRFLHGEHLILTARPERARKATETWLHREGFVTEDTRILMKPDMIRFQRSTLFKPAALEVLAAEHPGRKIVLVDDHLGILEVLVGSPFETRAAPNCWRTWNVGLSVTE
jgi:hypothetical protein